MEIRYIRDFCTLAETKNFLEAADLLFISQSTLSRHIQALEEELGAPLFTRTTRKVKLNEFGRLFLPYAKQILQSHQDFLEVFSEKMNHVKGRLSIGAIPVMGKYGINDVLSAFKKENPAISLNIVEYESCSLKDVVREKKCTFAFVRETEIPADEFEVIPYATDSMAVVLPAGHQLAGETGVEMAQLRGEDFVLLPEDTVMYTMCTDACKKAGFTPHVSLTGYRAENILEWVRQGLGVSLLMKKPIQHLIHPQIALVDIVPPIESRIDLIYLRKEKLSLAARRFLQYMLERAA